MTQPNLADERVSHNRGSQPHVIVIGAGVGGLTTACLLAKAGCHVEVFESQTYPGGSASTFFHKGYRFESGATVAGGFQPGGPHEQVGRWLDIDWKAHVHDPAWVVHLPGCDVPLTQDLSGIMDAFPYTEVFWKQQQRVADLAWAMAAEGLPFPPRDVAELLQLARVGLKYFPADLALVPFALGSVGQWMQRLDLNDATLFRRLIDATLLISAQTTSQQVNGLYGATAIDLPRQGVYHIEGGIGGIAEALVKRLESLGGCIRYRMNVESIDVTGGRVSGVHAKKGRRQTETALYPADFVVANTTPWSLASLLGDAAPVGLQREVSTRRETQSAFVLHIGVRDDFMLPDTPDHHQIVRTVDGPVGEGDTLYLSFSPRWDASRAPEGHRALTVSTHTATQPWWDLLEQDEATYYARKDAYTSRIVQTIDELFPGFADAIELNLPGTPVTYEFYTRRHRGMVGGFPQTSLFAARGPRTGIANLRLVGDSIFPGQSTAGVTLGGIRVARDVMRQLGLSSRFMQP